MHIMMSLCFNSLILVDNVTRVVESTSSSAVAVAVAVPIVVFVVITVIVVLVIVWFYRQYKTQEIEFTIENITENFQSCNPIFDRVQTLKSSGPHEKEFPSEKIKFVRELGEGAFGRVYQGMATNIIEGEESTIVAVKQLKTDTTMDDNATVVEFFKGKNIFCCMYKRIV